jgi:Fe-S oxidoreductase
VLSLDQFLHDRLADLPAGQGSGPAVTLLAHCTEKTADPGVTQRWRAIAARLGVALEAGAAGCCGMSGLFGHEAENAAMSRRIFDLSWRAPLAEGPVVATGFSCRCQSERLTGEAVVHPASLLAERLFGIEADRAGVSERRSRHLE